MKPDYEYIIDILDVFIQSDKPNVRIGEFDSLRDEDENKFYFNILILQDKGIMEGSGKNPREIGLNFNPNADVYMVSSYPWRLTANGHDFAKDIVKPQIKDTIISKFKYEGFSAIIDITKKLAIQRTEKLLNGILDD
jgi:hypothetical protein